MTTSVNGKAESRRKFFLINMAFGTLVTVIALYMVVTGEYSNLAERQASESTLNMVALFGFLYATGAWYGYIFFSKDKS